MMQIFIFILANTYAIVNQFGKKRLKSYQKAIHIDASEPKFHINLGNAYHSLQQYNEAIESFQDALNLEPENAKTYYKLAVVFSKKADYEKSH